ncbi:MAG: M20/M25/M40 family metallo-hydrolase [Flavobacteriaceae bacterium]|nr:M20/M25/M40 family metallo-hydrolase [Flavobacteriaceae bacterium]
MKNIYITLIAISISFTSCSQDSIGSTPITQISLNETIEIITQLASDEFMGRKPGTDAYDKTVSYVEDFLSKNNIKPYYESGYRDDLDVIGVHSYNIVALIGELNNNRESILLGAHLDHLGTTKGLDSIYNGANDNASGVTAVMQIAKKLNQYTFDKNIIIALFTGEESGLIGSKHLAKKLKEEGVKLSYMLNFEMIGTVLTTGKNQVYLTGYDKSDCAQQINATLDNEFVKFLPTAKEYNLFYRSDNYAFSHEFGIPSHTLSTFDFKNYDHYHKLSDHVSYLDIENMNAIINTSATSIVKLLSENIKITNIEVEPEAKIEVKQ